MKRVHKKANQNKVKPVSKPEHVKIAEKKEDTIETKHRVENSKVTKNQKFNPHKVIINAIKTMTLIVKPKLIV